MHLRDAAPGDELAVASVHVRSWKVAYRGIVPASHLDAMRPEDRASRYTFGDRGERGPKTIIALEGGRVLGFTTVGPCREEDHSGSGELYALYVDPDAWRRRVGTSLLEAASQRLAKGGFSHASLWVLSENVRARRFYEQQGWVPTDTVATREFVGVQVEEVRYVRSFDAVSLAVPE